MKLLSRINKLSFVFIINVSSSIPFIMNELHWQHSEIKNVSLIVNDTVSLYLKGYEIHERIFNSRFESQNIHKLEHEIDLYNEEMVEVFDKVRLVLNSQYSDGVALLLPVYDELTNIESAIGELNSLQKERLKSQNLSYKDQLDYVIKKDQLERRIIGVITILRYDVQYLIEENISLWEFYTILLVFICISSLTSVYVLLLYVNKKYIYPLHKLYDNLKNDNYDFNLKTKVKEIEFLSDKIMKFNNNIKQSNLNVISESKNRYRLMSTFAHESRTLLGVLSGNIKIMKDFSDNDDMKVISRVANDLSNLVDQFLSFSRFKESRFDDELEYVDIYNLLKEKCESFQYQARSNNESLILCAFDDIPRFIKTDKVRFKNIIDNLLSNAFKYSNGKGVQVKITLIDKFISISIRDYGRGIPSDKLEKVLHPYVQINKFEDIGSGLGLSIVHELIDQLGYELVIKSEEGVGTEFCILLNSQLGKSWTTEKRFLNISDESIRNERIWHDSLNCEDGKKREIIEIQNDIGLCDLLGIKYDLATRFDVQKDNIHHSFSDLTVLVAEDFPLNQKLIAKNLEKFDIIADFANDGIEVLKMISDKDYDVVFMDIKMPKKDGIQAAKDIRTGINKNIHIFALTAAYDFEKTIEENENLFDGFLGKPMDIEKLVKVLKDVQERKVVE